MYQMRMVQTATERHRLGITVTTSSSLDLGHRRHRELIVVLLAIVSTTATRTTTSSAATTTGTTQITVMVVVRGRLVFPGRGNRFGLDLHRQRRSRRRRCTIRYGQVWQAAAEKDSRVLSEGIHGVLRVGIAGCRTPRGNHAQVGIDREVLRAERTERCGVVRQARDGRLQCHHRGVQVGRLLPRVLLHVRKIFGVDGGVHGRWYHYPKVG